MLYVIALLSHSNNQSQVLKMVTCRSDILRFWTGEY